MTMMMSPTCTLRAAGFEAHLAGTAFPTMV